MQHIKSIYIDWNVFQDVIHERKGPLLAERLYAAKAKGYALPYSHAHIYDLLRGANLDWVKKDLDHIASITGCLCIGPLKDRSRFSLERVPPLQIYASMATQTDELPVVPDSIQFEPYPVDVGKLSENNIVIPYLRDSNNLMSPGVIEKLVSDFLENALQDYNLHKSFRESLVEVIRLNQPNNEEVKSWPIFQYLLAPAEEIEENFMMIFRSFLSIDGNVLENLSDQNKIRTAYGILDFFPAFKERIGKKNNLNNMITDSLHVYIASQCTHFICGDRKSITKANVVYRAFGIKTSVHYVTDFINTVEM
ncbi:hypothetical protein Jab_2c11490 [Janthinobacterium sp. HH01]|uniref:hypothetical protein n=1 Tax=Janthinobacterium sp. HH01 TaxID=1198452 RepID=UPI0002AEBCF5|nr:hypothetical protein [Janthinobacterium sp. HH01]ELX09089.1 hypothetical protein Jab_2c11490 [Janthinobacterium sp. HH01]